MYKVLAISYELTGTYWASPVYANGKVYFSNMRGVISVLAAAREFQLLAENTFETSAGAKGALVAKKDAASGKKKAS